MWGREDVLRQVTAAIRAVKGDEVPSVLEHTDSLVLRLGFDSMNMAVLSLELESRIGQPIALDQWIESHMDPFELTVGSLADHLTDVMVYANEPLAVSK
jgi:acyl carrier protein